MPKYLGHDGEWRSPTEGFPDERVSYGQNTLSLGCPGEPATAKAPGSPDLPPKERPQLRDLRCTRCLDIMKHFRLEVHISPQHLPILVPRDQRHLFNRESSLEEATCSFVPQIMKMKVVDV